SQTAVLRDARQFSKQRKGTSRWAEKNNSVLHCGSSCKLRGRREQRQDEMAAFL
ncbi:unnamed protein product, partial [Lampetra planeri]